jgi:hypothetical protein
MTNQWPLQSEMRAFYGNPDVNGDGVADRAWEDANLVRIIPPYRMYWSWSPAVQVKKIAVHKKCSAALLDCFRKIALAYPTEEERRRLGLDQCGGVYNFRTSRGSSKLSTHAYAAAIDIDPVRNPLGKKHDAAKGMIPLPVVKIFEDAGAVWGGRWTKRPDAQHFQFARVG